MHCKNPRCFTLSFAPLQILFNSVTPFPITMTTRGKPKNLPPIPSRDPTLETRPVPRERTFHVRSFGPGASPEIRRTVRSLKVLRAQYDAYLLQTQGRPDYDAQSLAQLLEYLDREAMMDWPTPEGCTKLDPCPSSNCMSHSLICTGPFLMFLPSRKPLTVRRK